MASMNAKIDNNRKRSINITMMVDQPLQQLVVEEAGIHTGTVVANHPLTKNAIAILAHTDIDDIEGDFDLPANTFGSGQDVAARHNLVRQYICDGL